MDFLPLASAAYQSQSVPNVLLYADLKPAPLHQRNRHLQRQREISEPQDQMLSLLSVYQHCILSTGLPVQNALFIFSKFGSGQQRSAGTSTQLSKYFNTITSSTLLKRNYLLL